MRDTTRTHRPSLALSIAGTLALVCLLALAPGHGEAQTLTVTLPQTAQMAQTAEGDGGATHARSGLPPIGTAFARSALAHKAGLSLSTTATGEDREVDGTVCARHVWHCGRDFLGLAPADGSLSEWAPHYFIAHSYGPFGQDILSLAVGDAIVVNGSLVTVEGAVSAPKYAPYDQIMEAVGWDATVFQTCIPDTELCLFVYARGATSTLDAANEARAFAGLDAYDA
jgi:hypothetical protein